MVFQLFFFPFIITHFDLRCFVLLVRLQKRNTTKQLNCIQRQSNCSQRVQFTMQTEVWPICDLKVSDRHWKMGYRLSNQIHRILRGIIVVPLPKCHWGNSRKPWPTLNLWPNWDPTTKMLNWNSPNVINWWRSKHSKKPYRTMCRKKRWPKCIPIWNRLVSDNKIREVRVQSLSTWLTFERFNLGTAIEDDYVGPQLEDGKVTLKFMEELMEFYKDQKKLHRKFAYKVSALLKTCSKNEITKSLIACSSLSWLSH